MKITHFASLRHRGTVAQQLIPRTSTLVFFGVDDTRWSETLGPRPSSMQIAG
jgi:hypothetical protein